MVFEYAPAKSASNRVKHGIDFEEATALWDDPQLIEIPSAHTEEPRRLVIGYMVNRCWASVVTDMDKATRIISVRRAGKEEEALYARANFN